MTNALATSIATGVPASILDPNWWFQNYQSQFFVLALVIVFVECGLFFPFLPGDSLLFAVGLFIAGDQLHVNLWVAIAALIVAAFAGNVLGYEIGRWIGPKLYEHDGQIIKRAYLDQSHAFFAKHGSKALVIGRFVPIVRTFVTVVSGVSRMERPTFYTFSGIGALLWVVLITLAGYFLGQAFPWLGKNIDLAIVVIVALSLVPISIEWWRHRGQRTDV
ncbi:MAG: DedA family protein [Nostocoides sp.]